MRTDGRTGGNDEAAVAFHNFANAPKREKVTLIMRNKSSVE